MRIFSKREFSKGWMTGVALGVAASVALVVSASSVIGLNTFNPNDPLSSAEVNANFTAVKTAVDDNFTRNTTNATGIATNVTGIATNVTGIATNVTDIAALQTGASCAGNNASDDRRAQ